MGEEVVCLMASANKRGKNRTPFLVACLVAIAAVLGVTSILTAEGGKVQDQVITDDGWEIISSLCSHTNNVTGSEVHRLYNKWNGQHHYTSGLAEIAKLKKDGWQDEGVFFVTPDYSEKPVWRLYNDYSGWHHYTPDSNERRALIKNGWQDEGLAWYSYDSSGVPVYRLFNQWTTEHLYTTDKNEYDFQSKNGWNAEGVAFYGMKPESAKRPLMKDPPKVYQGGTFEISITVRRSTNAGSAAPIIHITPSQGTYVDPKTLRWNDVQVNPSINNSTNEITWSSPARMDSGNSGILTATCYCTMASTTAGLQTISVSSGAANRKAAQVKYTVENPILFTGTNQYISAPSSAFTPTSTLQHTAREFGGLDVNFDITPSASIQQGNSGHAKITFSPVSSQMWNQPINFYIEKNTDIFINPDSIRWTGFAQPTTATKPVVNGSKYALQPKHRLTLTNGNKGYVEFDFTVSGDTFANELSVLKLMIQPAGVASNKAQLLPAVFKILAANTRGAGGNPSNTASGEYDSFQIKAHLAGNGNPTTGVEKGKDFQVVLDIKNRAQEERSTYFCLSENSDITWKKGATYSNCTATGSELIGGMFDFKSKNIVIGAGQTATITVNATVTNRALANTTTSFDVHFGNNYQRVMTMGFTILEASSGGSGAGPYVPSAPKNDEPEEPVVKPGIVTMNVSPAEVTATQGDTFDVTVGLTSDSTAPTSTSINVTNLGNIALTGAMTDTGQNVGNGRAFPVIGSFTSSVMSVSSTTPVTVTLHCQVRGSAKVQNDCFYIYLDGTPAEKVPVNVTITEPPVDKPEEATPPHTAYEPAEAQTDGCKIYQNYDSSTNSYSLEAEPAAGYTFKQWKGGLAEGVTNFRIAGLVDDGNTYTAVFEKAVSPAVDAPHLEDSPDGAALSLSSTPTSTNTFTLHQEPKEGYKFVKWTEKDTDTAVLGATPTVAPGGNYVAVYTTEASAPTPENAPSYKVKPEGAGTVTPAYNAENNTWTLTAAPSDPSRYSFIGWFTESDSRLGYDLELSGLNADKGPFVAVFRDCGAKDTPGFATTQTIRSQQGFSASSYALSLTSGVSKPSEPVEVALTIERTSDTPSTGKEQFSIALPSGVTLVEDSFKYAGIDTISHKSDDKYAFVSDEFDVSYGSPVEVRFSVKGSGNLVPITVVRNNDLDNQLQVAYTVRQDVPATNEDPSLHIASINTATPTDIEVLGSSTIGVMVKAVDSSLNGKLAKLYVRVDSEVLSIAGDSISITGFDDATKPYLTTSDKLYSMIFPGFALNSDKEGFLDFTVTVNGGAKAGDTTDILISTDPLFNAAATAKATITIKEAQQVELVPDKTETIGNVKAHVTLSAPNPTVGSDFNIKAELTSTADEPVTVPVILACTPEFVPDIDNVTVTNPDPVDVKDKVYTDANYALGIREVTIAKDTPTVVTIPGYISPFAEVGSTISFQIFTNADLKSFVQTTAATAAVEAEDVRSTSERTFDSCKMNTSLDKGSAAQGDTVNATVTITPNATVVNDTLLIDVPDGLSIDLKKVSASSSELGTAANVVVASNDVYDLIVKGLRAAPQSPITVKFPITVGKDAPTGILPIIVRSGDRGLNMDYVEVNVAGMATIAQKSFTGSSEALQVNYQASDENIAAGDSAYFDVTVTNVSDQETQPATVIIDTGGTYSIVPDSVKVIGDINAALENNEGKLSAEDVAQTTIEGNKLMIEGLEVSQKMPVQISYMGVMNESDVLDTPHTSSIFWADTPAACANNSGSIALVTTAGIKASDSASANGLTLASSLHNAALKAGALARVNVNLSSAAAGANDVVVTLDPALTALPATVLYEGGASGYATEPQVDGNTITVPALPTSSDGSGLSFVMKVNEDAALATRAPITIASAGANNELDVLVTDAGDDAPACDHEWGDWQVSIDPSCDIEGQKIRECAKCHNFDTSPVLPIGHDFKNGKCTRCSAVEPSATKHASAMKELQDAITAAKGLVRDNYTVESYDRVLAALEIAEPVANDKNASIEQISSALHALEEAQANLVKNQETAATPEGEGKIPDIEGDDNQSQNEKDGIGPQTPNEDEMSPVDPGPDSGNDSSKDESKDETKDKSNSESKDDAKDINSESKTENNSSANKSDNKTTNNSGNGNSAGNSGSGSNTSGSNSTSANQPSTINPSTTPLIGSSQSTSAAPSSVGSTTSTSTTSSTPSSSTYRTTTTTSSTPVTSKVSSKMPQTGVPAIIGGIVAAGLAAGIVLVVKNKRR